MKTKDFSKKLLVALTLMLALAMNAKAQKSTQDKRVMAFQTVMAMLPSARIFQSELSMQVCGHFSFPLQTSIP